MPLAVVSPQTPETDPLLTAENVAHRLNVSTDWVWDHSSRRAPLLPVIRIGDGVLRYRQSQIEEFVHERERLSSLRQKTTVKWGRPLFFPTEIEKHMGTSHQKGWVMVRGKKWYGYFRRTVLDPTANEPKPIITPVVLGLKSEMTKFEAREKLEWEIARLTGHTTEEGIVRNGSVTLRWFVHNRYLPLKEADWKEETAKVKKHLIEADLLAEFGEIRLERFDKLVLQAHLNKLAKTRSKDGVLQCRAYIRSIFAEAVDQDFLPKDPARKLKTPVNLRDTDKTVLTWDQLRAALAELELWNRILLKLDMTNALRPGELFAFRWSSLDEEHNKLDIRETIYKGKIRPGARRRGALRRSRSPGSRSKSWSSGGASRNMPRRTTSSSPVAAETLWTRATTGKECCTSWPRSWGCPS